MKRALKVIAFVLGGALFLWLTHREVTVTPTDIPTKAYRGMDK